MEEGQDVYDYELSLDDTPMAEDRSCEADETLVEEPEDDSPSIDGDDGDEDYHDDQDGNDKQNAPWSEETVQTEEMSRLGICVNTAARVVVCIACASVIKPLGLSLHFSKFHPSMSLPTAFCREVTDAYDLCKDPLQSRPGRIINAIYGLKLVDGYISCNTCGYACKTEHRIKIHIGKSRDCDSYQPRYAQAFRSKSTRMFFGVSLLHTPDVIQDLLDPVAYLRAKYAPLPFNQVPITCPTPRDANHFLNLENWHKQLEGKTGVEIHQVVREREPELRREVREVMERYARDAIKSLEKLDHEAKGALGDYLG